MITQLFYNIQNSWLLFLFIVVLTSLSIIGLLTFNILVSRGFIKGFSNESSGIYVGIVSLAIGVVIAFIITDEWDKFHDAEVNMELEANTIFLLYTTLSNMDNSIAQQELLKTYLCSIINMEFPSLQEGVIPEDDFIIQALSIAIYRHQPNDRPNQATLYGKSVDLFNQALSLRTQRLQTANNALANELWWVMILGYILVVVMSWFITGELLYRTIMTSFISIMYASFLFLAVVLNYPFKGDFGLTAGPFEFVAKQIGADCSNRPLSTEIINNNALPLDNITESDNITVTNKLC